MHLRQTEDVCLRPVPARMPANGEPERSGQQPRQYEEGGDQDRGGDEGRPETAGGAMEEPEDQPRDYDRLPDRHLLAKVLEHVTAEGQFLAKSARRHTHEASDKRCERL